MKKLLLLLLLLITPSPVLAMPIAGDMVTEVEGYKIKSIDGNLFEISKDNKKFLTKLIKNKDGSLSPISKPSISFYTKRFKKEYTVTFKDEAIISTEKVFKGEEATKPKDLKKQGYTFIGWDKETNRIESNLTINAVWKPKVYNVTFKNGSKIIETQQVEYGKEAIPPDMLNEAERMFIGWDKDLTIKEDTIINAKWKAKEYTVALIDELNNTNEQIKVEYMQNATLPTLQKEGYEFLGWDKNGEEIIDNTEIRAIWKVADGNIHFQTSRYPHSIEESEKIKAIKEWIINGKSNKLYGEYSLLKKARDSINNEYFYYFSILDSSIDEENGKFFLTINREANKERIEKNNYIKEKVEEISKSIMKEGKTEREGIERLQEWFSNNFKYISGIHTLYDAFLEKGGNCDAYAQIAQAVCDYTGIDCKYVTGHVPQGYHAWNMIKIDNEWLYVDFTFNIPLSREIADHNQENAKYYFEK